MPGHKWDLLRLSSGEKSALKRSAGIMMSAAKAEAVEGFYRALNIKANANAEKAYFAAMCMQCLWREEDHPQVKTMPSILRVVYQNPDATESSRKRCIDFLDISWDEDGFLLGKICNLVKKMKAEDASVMPDFEELAEDLIHWNHPNHYIQRKWLSTICKNNDYQENEEEQKDVD